MIKYLPKYKTSLFLSQNEYKPNIGATIKLHEIIKIVIAMSYFYTKNKIKHRIYNHKLINQNNIRTRKDREI